MAIKTKKSQATLFQTVRSSLIHAVNSGDIEIGEKLPTEADLASFFDASRPTINKVLRSLAQDGFLETRKRGGTIVLAPRGINFSIKEISDHVAAIGKSYRFTLENYNKSQCGDGGINWPDLFEGTAVLELECIHFSNNIPIQHEKRLINLDLAPEANSIDFSSMSPGRWLKYEEQLPVLVFGRLLKKVMGLSALPNLLHPPGVFKFIAFMNRRHLILRQISAHCFLTIKEA